MKTTYCCMHNDGLQPILVSASFLACYHLCSRVSVVKCSHGLMHNPTVC